MDCAAAASPSESSESPKPADGAGRRVLVVEDNRDAAESLAMLLELSEHTVSIAYTGSEGLSKAMECHPDVVLCDISLPGEVDGYHVARELSRTDHPPYLIAMTGYGEEKDRRNSHNAGFNCHLVKPVDPIALEELLATIRPPARSHR